MCPKCGSKTVSVAPGGLGTAYWSARGGFHFNAVCGNCHAGLWRHGLSGDNEPAWRAAPYRCGCLPLHAMVSPAGEKLSLPRA